MSSRANLFVYSNAATLLSSSLSNTGFENVLYCCSTTNAGPIQNFTATSLSSNIPSYMIDIYKVYVLSNYIITLFISKLSIEKYELIMKYGFREQAACWEKNAVIYYLDHGRFFICPHY